METKYFEFKDKNSKNNFLKSIVKKFMENDGEFIYRESEKDLLIFYDGKIDGGEKCYVIKDFKEIPEILKKFEFESFAVRSKMQNSMEYNRIIGDIIKKEMPEKTVNLEKPDIKLIIKKFNKNYIVIIKSFI